jgi:hypothetical protein
MSRLQLTHVEAAHEGDLLVYDAKFFVMGPEEHDVITGSVDGLDGIAAEFGQVEDVQREIPKLLSEVFLDVAAAWDMIRVAEDLDVGMQSFQCMFGVLKQEVCPVSKSPQYLSVVCAFPKLILNANTYRRVHLSRC